MPPALAARRHAACSLCACTSNVVLASMPSARGTARSGRQRARAGCVTAERVMPMMSTLPCAEGSEQMKEVCVLLGSEAVAAAEGSELDLLNTQRATCTARPMPHDPEAGQILTCFCRSCRYKSMSRNVPWLMLCMRCCSRRESKAERARLVVDADRIASKSAVPPACSLAFDILVLTDRNS